MGTCHLLQTQIKHALPYFKASLGVIVLALFCYLKQYFNLMMTWKTPAAVEFLEYSTKVFSRIMS